MRNITIAILITCHNRRDITLSCLKALENQSIDHNIQYSVYLVDAGSTDGSVEAIEKNFSDVKIIRCDSSIFWNEGMRIAFSTAQKNNYDFYLWLNDDTTLYSNTLACLLESYNKGKIQFSSSPIIIGSSCDPNNGKRTYGGLKAKNKWQPISFTPVIPSNELQRCDSFDGNCVLIPHNVFNTIGNLAPEYTHAMGDTDYGLRAKKKGIPILIIPGYAGTCSRNPPPSWSNPELSLSARIKALRTPKGLPPGQWLFFIRRHGGIFWPLYWLKYIQRILFPAYWGRKTRPGI